jgi:sodium/potassium/calcium exchanger 6
LSDNGPSVEAPNADDECRAVHKYHKSEQCAYIRKHCPDDEAGFTAYLDLYYCRMPHLKPIAFIVLISWLGLLFSTIGIAASDFFCIDLSTIAGILGMSESMAGVTFLAFGNGSPDVFSTFAAMSTNSGSLAVGELFGAAGFITAVVAGSMALIRPFHVAKKSFIRDVGFFIVAAAFSMLFLWDGKLHFWECAAMVVYYVVYVAFVVLWHWWLGRRRKKREKDAAARGHFIDPTDEYEIDEEPYRDDPEETQTRSRPTLSRGASREDWSALESGPGEVHDDNTNEDDEEEARDRWMSELASNMRLTRPPRSRKNTVTAVRPSLVGALEFQAVLKSLQKSRNIQTIPMDSRRYSDDPTYTTAQQQDLLSSNDDPASRPPYEVLVTESTSPQIVRHGPADVALPPAGRTRAVSATDARTLQANPVLQRLPPIPSEDDLLEVASVGSDRSRSRSRSLLDVPSAQNQNESPVLQVQHATPRKESHTRPNHSRNHSADFLAPPEASSLSRQRSDTFVAKPLSRSGTDDSVKSSATPIPRAKKLPKIQIPDHGKSPSSSRGTSPFPAYRDYPSPSMTASTMSATSTRTPSFHLPPPMDSIGSPESIPAYQCAEQEVPRRPTWLSKIWPYNIMPPPGVMIAALFPTIYHWHEKTWWEKCLGVVAAPSVFCLTVTLPVVENDKDNSEDDPSETPRRDLSLQSHRSKSSHAGPSLSTTPIEGIHSEFLLEVDDHNSHGGVAGHGSSATMAVNAEHNHRPHQLTAEPGTLQQPAQEPQLWNRWLTIVQLFLAPSFIVLSIFTQAPDPLPASWLVRPILISLLVSLLLLVPLLLTTTPTHRPRPYRIILSLAGFVVSIAWISAIASQVVGALKALAVILNMSHAIMGLTIFAVGNSLGDLVADVTVAKLGYPVMALSACFGGPMLNILLGVGLSGSYIMLMGAEHRHEKHPKKGLRFHSYHIEVSKTLVVSGITLLITLVGLLVAVPLNKWVLSRKIGWALIGLWTASTIFNVVIEVTGWLGDSKER